MFDTFEPFQKLEKVTFTFTPKRYETWLDGKIIKSGVTTLPMYFVPIQEDGKEKIRVTIFDNSLFNQIAEKVVFDEFITGSDRLQLVTLPADTTTNCMGIMALKMAVGSTRTSKNFNNNEPYCCNLFFKDSSLIKVTFSFSSPEKLLELYS